MTYETLGVLAGAYVDQRLKKCLTHVVEVAADGEWTRVLCDKVDLDNICDDGSRKDEVATCVTCARRDPRKKVG